MQCREDLLAGVGVLLINARLFPNPKRMWLIESQRDTVCGVL